MGNEMNHGIHVYALDVSTVLEEGTPHSCWAMISASDERWASGGAAHHGPGPPTETHIGAPAG